MNNHCLYLADSERKLQGLRDNVVKGSRKKGLIIKCNEINIWSSSQRKNEVQTFKYLGNILADDRKRDIKMQFNSIRCLRNIKQFIKKQKYFIRTKINECRTAVQDQSFNSGQSTQEREKMAKTVTFVYLKIPFIACRKHVSNEAVFRKMEPKTMVFVR